MNESDFLTKSRDSGECFDSKPKNAEVTGPPLTGCGIPTCPTGQGNYILGCTVAADGSCSTYWKVA